MKKYLLIIQLITLANGCSSAPTSLKTIERADEVASRLTWASLINPIYEENGKKYFLGYIEVDGDCSKSAALNMSTEMGELQSIDYF